MISPSLGFFGAPRKRDRRLAPPPPPPGFVLDGAPAAREPDTPPPPPPGYELDQPTGEAVDGDTLRMENGGNLRLWGIDAPELKQQGWDRNGNPIAIGQQSQFSLDTITSPMAVPGPQQHSSYGRPVAPVTDGGIDLGQQQLRTGHALAAPNFITDDPQRRFEYMQAERLARQNRQGMHQTFHQAPEQFRRQPMAAPDRDTVAQFWDTPTPMAGMRPEVEQEYLRLINDQSVPPEKVLEFARANGFQFDPAQLIKSREIVAANPQQIGIAYQDVPKPLTDLGDGRTGAAVRGFGNGVLPNFLEEMGAIPDTLGLTPNRENVWNSDRRLADIYANNLGQNEAITGYDRFAHPYVTGGAEIAGGVVVPMGKVRSAADLAKWGAGFGLASGLGQEGTIPERMISGAVGTGQGVVLGVGGGKALEAAAPLVGKGWRRLTGKGAPGAPQGLAEAPRVPDRIDIGPITSRPAEAPSRLDTTQPVPRPGQRVPDWLDINRVSAPRVGQHIPTAQDYEQLIAQGLSPIEAARRLAISDPRSMPMADANGPAMTQDMPPRQRDYLFPMERPQPISQPLSSAQVQARAAEVMPRDVLPIPSNQIGSVEEAARIDAGRYAEVKAPNERAELTRKTVRAWNGAEVPKVGPIDLVGWLRLQGGLADQAGELSHMGLTNAARKMDFAGQEQRFGPLVNEGGMNLDDAAHAAWEAGYFPDLNERPTIREFLDGLRDTYEGRNRHFLADDLPEIDRFYATQAERYDIEQRRFETGQPVMEDRSVPADANAPFAPPEAYQEWPAGGPDFAGNIDLRKLESPQDIARALDFTQRRVGFDAATRGRVSQAETERLASELGMTPEKLLSRRQGQALNAEEALAARQILAKSGNDLVNLAKRVQSLDDPGDELLSQFRQAWVRHVAIQEQVAGATAESGRALAQFKMAADSRAVRGDVLASLVRSGGGKSNLQEAAQRLIELSEVEPGKFNAFAEKATKPRWKNKISELYINFLLSWPQTHAVNITSNTLTALAQVPEHAAAAMIGKARQVLPSANVDRVIGSEVGARAFGLIQGAKEGARLFARAVRTGEPSDFVAKVEGQEYKAISGLKGEVIRAPTRMLTAEDEFFKGIARRMELNGLAARQAHREGLKGDGAKARIAELISDPPDDLLHAAESYGRYLTFQAKLGPAAQDVSNFANRHLPFKFILPFVRTPTNLLKFATERSPAAPLLKEWRDDFRAGGARRDLAVAKMTVGTGFGMAIYQAALDGQITGAAPSDPKKARLLYADGWKPYSIKIGDTYYSYRRLDPFSTTIGVAADMATLPEGMSARQREDQATLLVASIMGNLANKTWLSGVSSVVGALADPERGADNFVQRLVGSLLIPNVIAGTARELDPIQRETETMGDALKSRIPGMRDALLPRRDIWGREIRNEGGLGPDFLSPMWTSQALNDPVNKALLQLDYAPGYPSKKVGGAELSPQDYDRYAEVSGRLSHQALSTLVRSPDWGAMDNDAKVKAARKAVSAARKEARGQLFGGLPSAEDDELDVPGAIPAPPPGFKIDGQSGRPTAPPRTAQSEALRRARAATVPPPPAGFTVDGEAGGVNIYADLQRGIPGVRFTSGFRTPEYQADMRRRGYKPAWNSEHLNGAALDMLPPPGKSLGWLKSQVRKQHPNARLLVHDGHLHATFPGYYGAPVLGGAKRAGVRNPNAGMPPPPPGFTIVR